MDYIPIKECKDGHLYRIAARNSNFGIFRKEFGDFEISRWKFNSNYIFEEIHWDLGPPYGTVKPLEHIEKAPEFDSDEEKLKYLNQHIEEHREQFKKDT